MKKSTSGFLANSFNAFGMTSVLRAVFSFVLRHTELLNRSTTEVRSLAYASGWEDDAFRSSRFAVGFPIVSRDVGGKICVASSRALLREASHRVLQPLLVWQEGDGSRVGTHKTLI